MSLLGKKPITIPANVKVEVNARKVTVSSGAKKLEFTHRPEVKVAVNADAKTVEVAPVAGAEGQPGTSAYWGTTRALISNMMDGVTKGYEKKLEVVGVGYAAEVSGKNLKLKLGFANAIFVPIPVGVDVAIDKTFITVKGADRQAVGQFAAVVRSKRKPEPYNGKGVKYTDETIRRKEGKAFGQ
ncbi:MAG: 50S ribosomal protein L6 [Planctomycetes bacterium]|nr:50S ribosomal protein L6 [Planctomycetota bacterium]